MSLKGSDIGMFPTYTYRGLNAREKEIRLFRLQLYTPATSDSGAKIYGSIEHTSLLEHPSYAALSYV